MIIVARPNLRACIVIMTALAAAGCAGQSDAPDIDPTTSISTTTTLGPDGCPIPDQAACTLAADVATALVTGDADRLTTLSRPTDFVCDEEVDLPLPACAPGVVLTGHPLVDSRPVIEVLDDTAYADQTETTLDNVDPDYSDEHGDGAMRVLGVGTCGPDIPERRSYHVAFTAGVRAEGSTQRLVGSYELNLLDGEWLIGTAFLDSYEAWLDAYSDPLREHGCNPAPWQ